MDLALHAGQMPADAGSAVDEEQKGAIYRTIRNQHFTAPVGS